MCSNAEDLYEMANWVGKGAESRQKLIEKLQGSYFFSLNKLILVMVNTCIIGPDKEILKVFSYPSI